MRHLSPVLPLFDDKSPSRDSATITLASELDLVLTAQFAVAWAGETGETPRLGWWRCDLASEYGGQDLFQRLLPHTWEWAVLQAAREAARRYDAALRRRDHAPDGMVSMYHLGFELDERVEERLTELRRSGVSPLNALPGLKDVISREWRVDSFLDWVHGHGDADYTTRPIGRQVKGEAPAPLDRLARHLVAALAPLGDDYPLPHYRRKL